MGTTNAPSALTWVLSKIVDASTACSILRNSLLPSTSIAARRCSITSSKSTAFHSIDAAHISIEYLHNLALLWCMNTKEWARLDTHLAVMRPYGLCHRKTQRAAKSLVDNARMGADFYGLIYAVLMRWAILNIGSHLGS